MDGRVRIWNVQSGDMWVTVTGVAPIALSPDGKELATARTDFGIRVWRTKAGEHKRELNGHEGRIVAISFSPDGSLLLSGSDDKTARLWSMDSSTNPDPGGSHQRTDLGPLQSRRPSRGDRELGHDVRLWDGRTGKTVLPVLSKHFAVVSDARFSDDGRWLVTAGPQTAGLWHVRSHRFIFRLRGHRKGTRVAAASFVPASHRIVTAGDGWNGAHLVL